jgi:transposase
MTIELVHHHTSEALFELSRHASNIRTSHRFLAIRDLMMGESKQAVTARYNVSRASLWNWVVRYNESGADGLKDTPQPGRPIRLDTEKQKDFKQRIESRPTYEKDGVVRWRAVDIQRVLQEEYNLEYKSLSGVRRLCHALGFSYLTTRPSHPKRDQEAIDAFKKNSRRNLMRYKSNILTRR